MMPAVLLRIESQLKTLHDFVLYQTALKTETIASEPGTCAPIAPATQIFDAGKKINGRQHPIPGYTGVTVDSYRDRCQCTGS